MTEVCEVWSDGELAALVLGTTMTASAAFLGVILLCVWLAGRPRSRFAAPPADRHPVNPEQPG